jgi:hypothetical protein
MECLVWEVDSSIMGCAIRRFLDKAGIFHVDQKNLSDNGSEFTNNEMNAWTYEKQTMLIFIDPDKTVQNALYRILQW